VSAIRLLALALVAAAAHLPGAATAAPCPNGPAEGLTICELEVLGGEDAWRPDPTFGLRWSNPPAEGDQSIVAVHYRVLDSAGQVAVEEKRIDRPVEAIERLSVPPAAGVYTAEVWLEDAKGGLGPAAAAQLRFDDLRPAPAAPLPLPAWIGRTSLPIALRLGHPAAPLPPSTIRGYAVAVDRSADGDPCAAANRCDETETDLRGGIDEDTLALATLPEGTSYVHAVAVSGSGMKSTSVSHAILRVDTIDPMTELSGAPSGWVNHPVDLTATATDSASGMSTAGSTGPFTAIRVNGGAPVIAPGDAVETTVIAPGIHTVAHYARDAAGNVNDGDSTNGSANPAPATATVRIDTDPPQVAFSNSQDPLDPEAIEARISDSLSGAATSGGRVEFRPAGSGDRFEALPTRLEGDRLRARWDSDSYPRGRYEFRAAGVDLAGNVAMTTERANGSPMVLSAPLRTPTELRLRLRRPAARALPIGRGALLQGRLIGGRRSPMAGASVQVVERFDAGSMIRERSSTVRTGPGGELALRLPPGPSRSVVASFAGTPAMGRSQSAPLRLEVRGRVRMRASSSQARVGGAPIVFSGAVRGGNLPPGGKYVQLQFRLPGLAWTEFRTIRTDARGRFRHAYRFSDDDSRGVRFRFRAYAPVQDDWPYEAAASRPVVVRGI
jgi:hypothetical protein